MNVDPCDELPTSSPIELTLGDDWGLAFLYVDKTGAVIMLGADEVLGLLYVPYIQDPKVLDDTSGRAIVVDQPDVSFALGLERAETADLQADPDPPASHLQIVRVQAPAGLHRTIGHFDLKLINGRTMPEFATLPSFTDPVSGDKLSLIGYSILVPTPPGG